MDLANSARSLGLRHPRPWHLAAVTAAFYLAMLSFYLSRHDGGIGRLASAGSHWVVPGARVPVPVAPKSLGYDGQFFYVLAHDPTGRSQPWIRIDIPHYRQQRIFYPLLAYLASLGGREQLVPWALAAIGVASCCALAWLAALWYKRLGSNAWAGLCIPLLPGLVFCLFHDMPEPLAAVFLLGCLLAIRSGRHWFATLLLVLGVLTRETLVLAAGSIGACWTWERFAAARAARQGLAHPAHRLQWHLWLCPILMHVTWQITLRCRWGHWPAEGGQSVFGPPFAGVVEAVRQRLADTIEWRRDLYDAAFVSLLGFTVLLGVASIARRGLLPHEKLLFIVQSLMVTLLAAPLYSHRAAIMRYMWECQLLGCALVSVRNRRLGAAVSAAWIVLGIALALREAGAI